MLALYESSMSCRVMHTVARRLMLPLMALSLQQQAIMQSLPAQSNGQAVLPLSKLATSKPRMDLHHLLSQFSMTRQLRVIQHPCSLCLQKQHVLSQHLSHWLIQRLCQMQRPTRLDRTPRACLRSWQVPRCNSRTKARQQACQLPTALYCQTAQKMAATASPLRQHSLLQPQQYTLRQLRQGRHPAFLPT